MSPTSPKLRTTDFVYDDVISLRPALIERAEDVL